MGGRWRGLNRRSRATLCGDPRSHVAGTCEQKRGVAQRTDRTGSTPTGVHREAGIKAAGSTALERARMREDSAAPPSPPCPGPARCAWGGPAVHPAQLQDWGLGWRWGCPGSTGAEPGPHPPVCAWQPRALSWQPAVPGATLGVLPPHRLLRATRCSGSHARPLLPLASLRPCGGHPEAGPEEDGGGSPGGRGRGVP